MDIHQCLMRSPHQKNLVCDLPPLLETTVQEMRFFEGSRQLAEHYEGGTVVVHA